MNGEEVSINVANGVININEYIYCQEREIIDNVFIALDKPLSLSYGQVTPELNIDVTFPTDGEVSVG